VQAIDGGMAGGPFAPEHVTVPTAVGTGPRAAPLVLHPCHPNPSNPRVTVALTVASPGPVRVAIHDLAGRRVALLAEGHLAAGAHRWTWDGRDRTGRAVASGRYVCRAVGGGVTATQSLTLVR
jgi:hypothetical protein